MNAPAPSLAAEMTRVRDVVLPAYLSIPTGAFAASLMRRDLDAAAKIEITILGTAHPPMIVGVG